MADHMTAEQLRDALLKLADVVSLMDPSEHEDSKRADHLDSELRRLAARLSGMAVVPALSAQELRDLQRFAECCDDDDADGHDVPGERMKRLAKIGVVRNCGFGRHETTEFGDAILAAAPEPPHV